MYVYYKNRQVSQLATILSRRPSENSVITHVPRDPRKMSRHMPIIILVCRRVSYLRNAI